MATANHESDHQRFKILSGFVLHVCLARRDNRPGAGSACFHCRKDKHGSVATAMLAGGGATSAIENTFAAALHVEEVSSSSPSSGPLRMVAKILRNRTSKQCGKVSQRNFKFHIRETGAAVLLFCWFGRGSLLHDARRKTTTSRGKTMWRRDHFC